MTIYEKNAEIAKMLGWDFVRSSDVKIGGWAIPIKKKEQWILKIKDKMYSKVHINLSFHSDANWQFEALEYIHKQGHKTYDSYYPHTQKYQYIIDDLDGISCLIQSVFNSHKEAIFETLYLFSQYLKEKK